ncbi:MULTISPECIES: bifunctional biotin--[acetyl-CoA-carboxylase] ligase/biotin operon repressor BirA [Tatumella]|uniref:Bifunctional ligase/repressor BirA n=1 Tax=Tatumella ptyseos ATCC 33301 TaxID=1005995 RepID=A0A085JPM9_9GAMM|nr:MULTISPECIES: bifunctional biotin--[acetyl-CoA-carboxylase] ligase/biotin operon repressor BirA [Tatumella]KFD22425.1 biotin-protein ligase/biotin operon repressor [Tatumella ptyseos ATCC 33301]
MKDYSVPLKIIRVLSDGEFHSGEQLGEKLGMSRAAINQHIHTLKNWGIDIYTVTGKGYCLSAALQLLDDDAIRAGVRGSGDVQVIPVIDSTNQYLMERMSDLRSGDTCIAEYQQAGRGRRGRQWFSPFGANLYMSMYWRLEQGPAAAMGLSLVVGIVIAEALQSAGAKDVRVKWPNDLYLNDRKLAGILVELSGKTGDVAHIVIGAGINLMMRNVDDSVVNQQWISLQEAGITIDRNALTVALINKMREALTLFETEGLAPFIDRWASLDNFINRPVKLVIGEREIHGVARGIDSRGGLLLEQEGEITGWVGGEISLRPVQA